MSTRSLLLIDDDRDDQDLFMDALLEIYAPSQILTANNGEDGLRKVEEVTPDLIFLDLNMPLMNGFDCLTQLRRIHKLAEVPIIIFSTSNDPATIKTTYDLGATAFLRKPNDYPTLRHKLKKLMQKDLSASARSDFSMNEFIL